MVILPVLHRFLSQETSNLFELQAQPFWFPAAIEVTLLKLRKTCRGSPGQPAHQEKYMGQDASIFLKLDAFQSKRGLAFCGCIDTQFHPRWVMLLFGLAPTYLMWNTMQSTLGSPGSQKWWGHRRWWNRHWSGKNMDYPPLNQHRCGTPAFVDHFPNESMAFPHLC